MALAKAAFRSDVDVAAPMTTLRHSHELIVDSLQSLADLPRLADHMRRARRQAAAAVDLFEGPVFLHHADEEKHLFPAVIASAQPGPEREKAQAMAERLTAEHRAMERAWKKLEGPLRAIAAGKPVHLDEGALAGLVAGYIGHARFEEAEYLPFAERILARDGNHMAALGYSLHLSHVKGVSGHI